MSAPTFNHQRAPSLSPEAGISMAAADRATQFGMVEAATAESTTAIAAEPALHRDELFVSHLRDTLDKRVAENRLEPVGPLVVHVLRLGLRVSHLRRAVVPKADAKLTAMITYDTRLQMDERRRHAAALERVAAADLALRNQAIEGAQPNPGVQERVVPLFVLDDVPPVSQLTKAIESLNFVRRWGADRPEDIAALEAYFVANDLPIPTPPKHLIQ
ncbi:MAG TPA: hypothetical protein VD735_05245 [Candidatus Saccharimonadales bacterium]|nr:hypothetical protein [Candidatus Saccharimonadales bacterium]